MHQSVLRYAKQNILFRLLPLLFAAIMLLSGAPAMVRFFSQQLQELTAVAPENLPVDEHTLKITLDGSLATAMDLPYGGKQIISADGLKGKATYQWQIKHPEKENVWVNIYDATSKELPVTAALVKSVLSEEGTTKLRCRAYTSDYAYLTPAITVKLADLGSGGDPLLGATGGSGSSLGSGGQTPLGSGVSPLADDAIPEFVTVTIEYLQYDFQRDAHGNLVIVDGEPVLETEGTTAFTSYKATIQYNTGLETTVHFPTMVGYDSYFGDAETTSTSYTFDLDHVTDDLSYVVKYKPAMVDYSVRYFFQNIYDDLYVENSTILETEYAKGRTGATPPDSILSPEVAGFTVLYYQPDSIAADGSTMFEVYFERNYYLMEFDCNGGYGVETAYVRYDSFISIPNPVRAGYQFGNDGDGNGWDLVKIDKVFADGESRPDLGAYDDETGKYAGNGVGDTIPAAMPAYNSGYKAIWDTIQTKYTEVYWLDNGDGTKSYLDSQVFEAESSSIVTCLGEHSHNTDCTLFCGKTVHTHDDGNCVYCALMEHIHNTGSCSCGKPEHAHNDGTCTCGETEHKHGDGNCICGISLCTNHTRSCYNFTSSATIATIATTNDYGTNYRTYNGFTIYRRTGLQTRYYVQINGSYYQITNYGNSLNADDLTYSLNCHTSHDSSCCTTKEHSHDTCNCTLEVHAHSDGCCTLTEHVHGAACCTLEPHTHSESCYSCGKVEHAHPESLDEYEYVSSEENVRVEGDGSTVVNVTYQAKLFEIRFMFARSYVSGTRTIYEVANTTTNGNIVTGWGCHTVTSLPTVTGFTVKTESINQYTYYYIAIRARLGTNIENLWPGNVIGDVTDSSGRVRRFGSWATEEGTPYRSYSSDHANIVGPYPYMSSDMIKEGNEHIPYTETDANGNEITYYVAQRMGAWWGTRDALTFDGWPHGPIDEHRYHIYYESTADEGDRYYNGKWYKLAANHTFNCAHNGSSRVDPFYYNGRTCINDTKGLANDYQKDSSNYASTSSVTDMYGEPLYNCPNKNTDDACNYCNCFYYDGQDYTLSFYNYNADSEKPADVEIPYLGKWTDKMAYPGDAEYPKGIEPGAYEFGGWYTTAVFDPATLVTEADWADKTMPFNDVQLYAKWTPIFRNVTFYSAFSDIKTDQDDTSDTIYHFMKATDVTHGTTLGYTYYSTPEWPGDRDPAINNSPEASKYDFIGWFYMDEDNKKRFAPDSMEVTRNLLLFAEWQTSIDTTYEVHYVLKEDAEISGTQYLAGTKIGETIAAHSSVGKTKTFMAKGGVDLYDAFQTHFFPTTNSHSILMDADEMKNTYTFEYRYDDRVYYTVRYVDYATRTEILPSVTKYTDQVIVTEKFLPRAEYLPQSYYIRKALAYDGTATEDSVIEENIITFYYVKDTQHGMYSIEHYLEKADSTDSSNFDNYYQYESMIGSDDLGYEITADIRNYEGYTHVPSMNTVITYKENGDENETTIGVKDGDGRPYGAIEYTGLTIKIYYKRNMYPYIIEYREYGSDDDDAALQIIADGKETQITGDEAKFDTSLSHTAPSSFVKDGITYEYYQLDADDEARTKSMTIRVVTEDDPSTGDKNEYNNPNKLVFYYQKHEVTVVYNAICTAPGAIDFGGVTLYSERSATASALSGSNANVGVGYVFVGWYTDEACTQAVDPSWRFTPGTPSTPDVQNNEGTKLIPKSLDVTQDTVNYYALFVPISTSMTIENQLTGGSGTQNFVFHVKGQGKLSYVDFNVVITGSGSVVIDSLPIGDYQIACTTWSWESAPDDAMKEITATQSGPNTVTFTNTYADSNWLDGEAAPIVVTDAD